MSMTPACAKPHTPVDRRQDPRGDPGCGPVLAAAGGHGGRPPEDGVEQLLGRLNGSTGSTGKLPSDVQTVAAAVRSTASTANTNATTAQASAATAQTTANTVTSDLSTALNGVAQGMLGGATTATPTTVGTRSWRRGLSYMTGSTARQGPPHG